MDMETFVRECKSCDVSADKEKASELLRFAAQLGEAVLAVREKRNDKIPYSTVMEMYNRICYKNCQLSPERKKYIKTLFSRKFTIEDFEKVFKTIQNTPFLRGENERGWHPSFDWIMKPANFLKIYENAYGTAEKSKPSYDLDAIWDYTMKSNPIGVKNND